MGGCAIWDTSILERENRGDSIHRKIMHHKCFEEEKGKHDNLHHQRGGGHVRGIFTSISDKSFYAEPRILGKQSNTIPRQHECNLAQKERAHIKFNQDETHRHTILFNSGQDKKGRHWL